MEKKTLLLGFPIDDGVMGKAEVMREGPFDGGVSSNIGGGGGGAASKNDDYGFGYDDGSWFDDVPPVHQGLYRRSAQDQPPPLVQLRRRSKRDVYQHWAHIDQAIKTDFSMAEGDTDIQGRSVVITEGAYADQEGMAIACGIIMPVS